MDVPAITLSRFRLGDEDLDVALDMLSAFYPTILYHDGWGSLTTEWKRRRDGHLPSDLVMMRSVFATLPSVVQAFLRNHSR